MPRLIKGLKSIAHFLIDCIQNLIHGAVDLSLLAFAFMTIACENMMIDIGQPFTANLRAIGCAVLNMSFAQVTTCIGAIVIVLFGITSVYDFGYDRGLNIIVPPLYRKIQEKHLEKQARIMMTQYYDKEINNIKEYEKERADYLLQSLGLKNSQFSHIRYEIIKARALQCKSKDELENKAKTLIYNTQCIKNLKDIPEDERAYSSVTYYLDLYSAFYDRKLCSDFANIMYTYIVQTLGEAAEKIDYIIIPQGSNLLLGIEVGKRFEAKVIALQKEGRVQKTIPWDGAYFANDATKTPKHVIILHDVLVSGKRVYESLETLKQLEKENRIPENSFVFDGVFCIALYKRDNFEPFKELKSNGIPRNMCHCLLTVSEKMLQAALEVEKSAKDEL